MTNNILPLPPYPSDIWKLPEAPPLPLLPANEKSWVSSLMKRRSPESQPVIRPKPEPTVAVVETKYRTFVSVVEDIEVPPEEQKDSLQPLASLRAGDVLEVLQRSSSDKWLGRRTRDGYIGFFMLDERIRPIISKKVRALLEWTDKTGYGISLRKGRQLDILYQHSSWWFWAKSGKAIALVPFNYVEPIPEEEQAPSSPTPAQLEPTQNIKHDFQYPSGSILRCLWPKNYADPRILPLKMHETFEVIKPDMNDVWGLGRTKEGRIGLFAHSLVSPVLDPVRPRRSPLFMRATTSRSPRSIAEPGLSRNDVVEVLYMRKDHYWLSRKADGENGLFNKSLLRPVLDRRMYEDDGSW